MNMNKTYASKCAKKWKVIRNSGGAILWSADQTWFLMAIKFVCGLLVWKIFVMIFFCHHLQKIKTMDSCKFILCYKTEQHPPSSSTKLEILALLTAEEIL